MAGCSATDPYYIFTLWFQGETSIKGNQVKINQARTGPKDRRASDRGGGRRITDPPAI